MPKQPLLSILIGIVASLIVVGSVRAQVYGPVPSPYESIQENTVSVMAAYGETLWIGPGLNRNIANAPSWHYPEGATKVTDGPARVFSLTLGRDTVIAGLGYSKETADGEVKTGDGFHLSFDGGQTWLYSPQYVEQEDDTVIIYGGQSYSKLPITVPQQSPPFEIDHFGDTILSANWASGLIRSRDLGESWERLILPPQSADRLVPEQSYTFTSSSGNSYDPRFDQNLLGFAVLVDDDQIVWAGTAGGLNISENALKASIDSIRWEHVQVTGDNNGLISNWIIDIKQQPGTGDIWMTNWPSGLQPSEQYGIVRTADGGNTFDRYLLDEKINDLGFNGSFIYAAGDDGLFISPDNGLNWNQYEQIESVNTFIKKEAQYLCVATTLERVFVGTTDGIASTANNGESWQITRVNFPLAGGNRYQQEAPDVEAYAYPSPFSPTRHGVVRIKFEVEQQGDVKVRLFDFGMNLIREIENGSFNSGTYEAVWDGISSGGRKVANGPVFYLIETPRNVIKGKFLVID
ncbi:hypothetical protein G3570_06275 [Balneolaceae bacterium YR4-1]|uniref:FlgD Ig-like domain-containing protein n=1 Tax=Halalkalibaculum roseum TaxID=2709311 RepID=A0A6M1STK2_9BACT|nr:hypothetical protein [Halalkalibaculum roseum]NGP76230.1 hypothetical protein [Halalkalibaculum roseum]